MNTRELQQYILNWNSKAQEYCKSKGAVNGAAVLQRRIAVAQAADPGIDSLFIQQSEKATAAFERVDQKHLDKLLEELLEYHSPLQKDYLLEQEDRLEALRNQARAMLKTIEKEHCAEKEKYGRVEIPFSELIEQLEFLASGYVLVDPDVQGLPILEYHFGQEHGRKVDYSDFTNYPKELTPKGQLFERICVAKIVRLLGANKMSERKAYQGAAFILFYLGLTTPQGSSDSLEDWVVFAESLRKRAQRHSDNLQDL